MLRWIIIIVAVVLVALGAAAAYLITSSDVAEPVVDRIRYEEGSSARGALSLEAVADLPVSEMYAEASDRAAAGQESAALVIYETAAARGHAPSARAVGEMYDPSLWGTTPSPLSEPDAVEARRWYGRAADLGDDVAQARLTALAAWEEQQ